MTSPRLRRVALVGAGFSMVSLLAGYAFAGTIGLLGVTAYLGCILAPGAAFYAVIAARFRSGPSNLLEVVFYSNLMGFALVEGVGWVLARSGWFSLAALLGVSGAIVGLFAFVFRRELRDRWSPSAGPFVTVPTEEVVFLGIAVAAACLLLMPLLTLFSNGFYEGIDTLPYARAGWLIASTGHWPPLGEVLQPNSSQSAIAPGAPVVYAVFAAMTGVFAPSTTAVVAIIPVALTPVGLCLLVRRYSDHPLLTYGLPIVWLVGSTEYGSFLYNNLLLSVYYGQHPDAVLGVLFLVAVLLLLTDLSRGTAPQWFETVLLSCAILANVVVSQLNFIVVVAALLFFGVGILWRRGWRWTLVRLGIVVAPTVAAWTPYLVPGNAIAASPGAAKGTLWQLSQWQVNWSLLLTPMGLLAEVCATVVALAIAADLYERFRGHPIGSAHSRSTGIYAFLGIALVALYLSYTNVLVVALGITAARFLPYASLAAVPVIAYGCDRFFHLGLPSRWAARRAFRRWKSVVSVGGAVGVSVLLVYSGVSSMEYGINLQSKVSDPGELVTPDALAAAHWIEENAPGNAVIAIDGNGGNAAAVRGIATYSEHPYVIRPRGLLSAVLQSAPPQNTLYVAVDLVMTSPTVPNASAAAALGIDYYVFQDKYSLREVTAFSLLSYFSLVYSNSQFDVFEYVGGSAIGFIPAVSYCASSPNLVSTFSPLAYSYAVSFPALPKTPNWVTSVSSYPAGSLYATYCLEVPTAGNYTLLVHSDADDLGQFINVSLAGHVQGPLYFVSPGLTFATPLEMTLPQGSADLTLSFQGGRGAINPIDYLVFVPAPTPGSEASSPP